VLLALLCCLAAAVWLYDRYYFSVRWPSKIQEETTGTTLAGENALISKERHFAYGEGFARWRYKIEASTPSLQRLCGPVPVRDCSFNRSRKIGEGVDLNVDLTNGVLTVEEVWS